MIVVQSSAVRAATRARYYARRRPVILRAPLIEPDVRFTTDHLANGVSLFAHRNARGDPLTLGAGDDYAEALAGLYEELTASRVAPS